MAISTDFQAHLDTGLTTLCRAWAITRTDGVELGFTDHDGDLSFEDISFAAQTGMTALALQQSTGLSVDNTEALGALSASSLSEVDILAGRLDGAEVRAWLVNWANVAQRELVFRGTLGEVTRVDGSFRAEVRGLAEKLNKPIGRVIQKTSSVLVESGGEAYQMDQLGFTLQGPIRAIEGSSAFLVDAESPFADGWFQHGGLLVTSGAAQGLKGVVKRDELVGGVTRRIELWEPMRMALESGDTVEIQAGFDGTMDTARYKFDNLVNFQGFPDVPEDDWVLSNAVSTHDSTGGSRR